MGRTNCTALLVGSAWSNMAEVNLPLLVMFTAPAPGMHQVYVLIKQVVALCSQTPLNCSIAGPPEKERASWNHHVPGSWLLTHTSAHRQ